MTTDKLNQRSKFGHGNTEDLPRLGKQLSRLIENGYSTAQIAVHTTRREAMDTVGTDYDVAKRIRVRWLSR